MAELLADIADKIWSYPVVGLCLLSALFFTLRLGLVQLRALPHALALLTGRYDDPNETGAISHLQALSAALSGTIGIGNIAGVAIAISVGGPGAVLWMWVAGLFGMATKFVECTLGTHYRQVDTATGEVRGGPMFYIVEGLGPRWRPVAAFYAFTIAFAGFGFSCMFQSNQAASALHHNLGVPTWVSGLLLALLTGAVIVGGITSIGRWAARLVPATCLIYVGGAFVVCAMNAGELPAVLGLIWEGGTSAQSGSQAALGGGLGGVIAWGVRRAVFSNEAGLGSAAIAHAAVKTDEPVREGIVASMGPLIDTIIVSGATAFVIILSGNYGDARMRPVAPAMELASQVDVPIAARIDCEPETRACPHGTETFTVEASTGSSLRFAGPYDASEAQALRFSVRGELREAGVSVTSSDGAGLATADLGDVCSPGENWRVCTVPLTGAPMAGAEAAVIVTFTAGQGSFESSAPRPVKALDGIALSSVAFDQFITGFGTVFITFAGFFFALSTMITWSYYGETASSWLFGERSVLPYRLVFVLVGFVGAVYKLGVVISISDIMVGLLVVPNVIAITALSPKVATWSKDYFARLAAGDFERR